MSTENNNSKQQHQTISIQIPQDAKPGDTLAFVMEGTELQVPVPEDSCPGDVLELQIGVSSDEQQDDKKEDACTRVELSSGEVLTLYSDMPPENKSRATSQEEQTLCDGTHAMAWPAGLELAQQLPSLVSLFRQGKGNLKILEVGSGLGLVGLAVAAHLKNEHAEIVLTDALPAISLLQYNLQQNQIIVSPTNLRAEALDWTRLLDESTTDDRYDWIIGSDLLYNTQVIESLVQTLQSYLKPASTGHILLAVRWRKPDAERVFFRKTQQLLHLDWNLAPNVSHVCEIPWEEYGDLDSPAFRKYWTNTMVSIQGVPKALADIKESDAEQMSQAEFDAWERAQIQIYVGSPIAAASRKRSRNE